MTDPTTTAPGPACGLPPAGGDVAQGVPAAPPVYPEVREVDYEPYRKRTLYNLFGIDLRTLALYRVLLSSTLLLDLFCRAFDLNDFYTDSGVMPRWALTEKGGSDGRLYSLYLISGSAWVQSALFVVAAALALLMMIGYRTRLATFASWVMLTSLQARNPMVLDGGDVFLRTITFFAMFLPLGARFSVDSAVNPKSRPPNRYASAATFAAMLQVCYVYLFTALLKWHPIWLNGEAVWYAMNIDIFTTHVGLVVREYLGALEMLTYGTLIVEFAAPTLVFMPIFSPLFRILSVLSIWSLHFGLWWCMYLGIFPWTCIIAWSIFIPSWFWDRLFGYLSSPVENPERAGLRIYYDGHCHFCRKTVLLIRTFLLLPSTPLRPAQEDESVLADLKSRNSWVVVDHTGKRRFGFEAIAYACRCSPLAWPIAPVLRWGPVSNLGEALYRKVAANRNQTGWFVDLLKDRPLRVMPSPLASTAVMFCILYALAWNIRTLNFDYWSRFFPTRYNFIGTTLFIDQYWSMFAPYPMTNDGWWVVQGKLKDGTEIDVLTNKPVSWEKPAMVAHTFKSSRWRKYMLNMNNKDFDAYKLNYGQYLCKMWNETHAGPKKLDNYKLFYMCETSAGYGNIAPPFPQMVWTHYCFEVPTSQPAQAVAEVKSNSP